MKNILKKIPYAIFIGLSLITLLQIGIIFKDSYSKDNKIEFIGEEPNEVDLTNLEITEDSTSTLININFSSIKELDSLPGIGATLSQKIIDNRPYTSKDELVSKAGITTKVLDEIKDLISL